LNSSKRFEAIDVCNNIGKYQSPTLKSVPARANYQKSDRTCPGLPFSPTPVWLHHPSSPTSFHMANTVTHGVCMYVHFAALHESRCTSPLPRCVCLISEQNQIWSSIHYGWATHPRSRLRCLKLSCFIKFLHLRLYLEWISVQHRWFR